jgi:hypothetical protein
MSIKANIKKLNVPEVRPNEKSKVDLTKVRSSYAQSEMKNWIRSNSTKRPSELKKKGTMPLETASASAYGRRKYMSNTKAADFGPLRQERTPIYQV